MKAILKLDAGGLPVRLISWDQAAVLIASDKVLWSCGETVVTLRGGYNTVGERSLLTCPSIIAVKSASKRWSAGEPKTAQRRVVYHRDEGICMYCADRIAYKDATLDHVHPKSRGGGDEYTNIVLACQACNSHKNDRTPKEADMKLLAVPYVPNPAARMILTGRHILADQMEYLNGFANLRDRLTDLQGN